ncbi:MAG: CAP domain-containing protein [Candidatus Limnocylindrales bacterium]
MTGFVTLFGPAIHKIVRRLCVSGLALTLAGFATVATAGPALGWDGAAFSPADEQLLFSLTNQDRASAGLNALVNDAYLHTKAEWRAQDMGDRNYFSHEIPPGNGMVFATMQSDGYCFSVAGENIGLSTYDDATATNRIETAFMGSTGHRANILGAWAHMGVGAYKAADGRKLYAVLFSIPCGVTVPGPEATPPPVVVPTPAPVVVPTPAPVVVPKPKPTARPTVKPTPTPTPTPTATPSPTPTPTATPIPHDVPTAMPISTATPVATATPAAAPQAGLTASLRVRESPAPAGPVDSVLHWLFGGIFGW